jgi:hypothetical protein
VSDQTTPEETEEVTVGFTFHNPSGEGETTLSTPLLGLDLYILIRPGDNGPEVEASHATPDEVAGALSIVLAAILQTDNVTDERRGEVYELLEGAAL